ncbi:MAG: carboxymuconolactone decarboxylase family protein [Actinomycetota bacterium]
MPSQRAPLLSIDDAVSVAADVDIMELKAHTSLYRVLFHQPRVAKRINDLIETLMSATETELDARLRELIIMRIGWVNGGVYEWSHHWRIAQGFGLEEHELLATRDWEAHDHWSLADRAALAATDETLGDGVISRSTWAECEAAFPSDALRLELVTTIGSWKMMSELVRSLDVPLEDGVPPWPPDGVSPGRRIGAAS